MLDPKEQIQIIIAFIFSLLIAIYICSYLLYSMVNQS